MNAICINFPQFYYEFYRINNEEEHKNFNILFITSQNQLQNKRHNIEIR
jgi:hypothetical protein